MRRRSTHGLTTWARLNAKNIREILSVHRDLLLILLLFLSMRLSLLVISRPQGYLQDSSDYDFYLLFGRLSDAGLYPDVHYWTEYPPIFPWIAVAAYKATEIIPTLAGNPILPFRLGLGCILLAFDTGNLLLIYLLAATAHDLARARQSAWIYALLFTPLHVWLGWFDSMPLFFLLLAIALATRGNSKTAALATGIGFMVKVFPILALPVLIKSQRGIVPRVRSVAIATAAIGAIAAPFALLSPAYLLASFQSMVSRSPWETIWAIHEGYYGFGQVAPLQERTNPATAMDVVYQSNLPWGIVTLLFALFYLLIWTCRLDLQQPIRMVAFAGLTVNLFMLYSKGYSPQFLVYVVPFALLALPAPRAVAYLVTLGGMNLVEFPVYVVLLSDQTWVLRDLVLGRAVILILLSWEYLGVLGLIPSRARAGRAAAAAALATFILWLLVVLPGAVQYSFYSAERNDPNALLIDYLAAQVDPGSAVVFSDPGLYRAFYPFLHSRTALELIDLSASRPAPGEDEGMGVQGGPYLSSSPKRIDHTVSRYSRIFVVRQVADENGKRLEELLGARAQCVSLNLINDLAVTVWSP